MDQTAFNVLPASDRSVMPASLYWMYPLWSASRLSPRLVPREARYKIIDRTSSLTTAERKRAGEKKSILSFSRAEQLLPSRFMAPLGTGAEAPGIFGYFSSLESSSPGGEISPKINLHLVTSSHKIIQTYMVEISNFN